jgi:cell division cycle 2-like protein
MTSVGSNTSTPSRKRSRSEDDPELDSVNSRTVQMKKQHSGLATSSRDVVPRPAYSRYAPPRTHHPAIAPSRSVYSYERLNQIEEGSYGVVFRARDKQTGEIVALKKLKLEEEKNGFPITALREINALMACRHENIVNVREVVVGDTLTQYVSHTYYRVLLPCMTYVLFANEEFSSSWTSLSTTSRHSSRTCLHHSCSPRSKP